MTSKEIRKKPEWTPPVSGVLVEIAAQLAELNEHLRLTTPNKTPRSRYEGL